MSPLLFIKQYAYAVIGLVLLALFGTLTVKFYKLRSERDSAKLALVEAQALLKEYKRTGDEATKRTAELMALAASHEVANAEEIARLKAQVAKSDEEARQLAIAAGKVIGGLR